MTSKGEGRIAGVAGRGTVLPVFFYISRNWPKKFPCSYGPITGRKLLKTTWFCEGRAGSKSLGPARAGTRSGRRLFMVAS